MPERRPVCTKSTRRLRVLVPTTILRLHLYQRGPTMHSHVHGIAQVGRQLSIIFLSQQRYLWACQERHPDPRPCLVSIKPAALIPHTRSWNDHLLFLLATVPPDGLELNANIVSLTLVKSFKSFINPVLSTFFLFPDDYPYFQAQRQLKKIK